MSGIAKLPAYSEYQRVKDSWFDSVPSHWQVTALRGVLKRRNEKNDPVQTTQILSLSIAQGVTLYSDRGRGGNKRKGDLRAYKIAREGDIVLNSMNVIVGAVGLSRYTGAISPVYYALYPATEKASIRYYDKIFSNVIFQRYLMIYGRGILIKKSDSGKFNTIRMKISPNDLKRTLLPLPPLAEQNQIVAYLQAQDRQIAKLVRGKRRLIELLNVQKQTLIHRAVTRGLNPDVPLKPSGIDWLGDVPAHWDMRRARSCIKFKTNGIWGEDPDPLIPEENVTCYRVADFDIENLSVRESSLTLRRVPVERWFRRLLESGDILLEKSGGGEAQPVGRVVAVSINGPSVCSNFISRIVPDRTVVEPRFLLYVLHLMQELRLTVPAIKQTTGIQNLDEQQYLSNSIAVPNIDEQREIVQALDKELASIESLRNQIRNQITAIRDYRDRLVSEVVTGQIDVRGWQPPAEEAVEEETAQIFADAEEGEEVEEENGDDKHE